MDLQSDQKYYTKLQEEISKVFESDDRLLMVASVAEAADKLAVVLRQKALIQYDIVTGLFRVGVDDKLDFTWYTELDAKNFFMIVIAPLVRMITGQSPGGVRSRGLNKNEQEQLWCAVKQSNKINSRLEAYEKIEPWDGKPRIATFMKEYFECDCMPNQFLLFMTSVLAKWKNPMARVEYFFDFIGEGKGCLAGDVKINVYTKNGNAYRQHKVRIARLFDLAKTESSRFVVRSFDETTGEMGYSEAEVIYSGEKQCYLLTCEDGSSIECSGNHRFYTDDGWKNILKLNPGDEIYMNAKGPTKRHDENYRSSAADAKEYYVKYHPVIRLDARKKVHRIAEHKAIWEANANGLSLEQYIDLLNHYDGRPLVSIPRGYDVHHVNWDHFDNDINNLQVLSKEEHGRLHGKLPKPKQYLARKVKIKSIVPTQVKKTYDLSCVIGEHNYVANEFITHNTGKTSLFVHLFGTKAMILGVPSRKEDLFVSAYANGALVVCDDECTWIGKGPGKMSYDEFKTLVTLQIDTFSRKHAQPESHYRPFVIVRTSNDPRTVFSANERRQIIFNVGLAERECRHWDMSDYDRDQLLAEAKDYVEKHNGEPYRLSKDEERLIEDANLENFDTETVEYDSLIEFFSDLRDNPQDNREFILEASDAKSYTTCNHYHRWCKKKFYKPLEPRIFWRQVGAIQRKCPGLISFDKTKKKNIRGVATRVIGLLPKKTKEVEYDEIPE